MSEHSQSNNSQSGDGGQSGGANSGGEGENQGGSTTQSNQGGNQQSQKGAENNVDLKTLPADQIAQALENPELWKTPRMKELLDSSKELRDLKDKASKDEEDRLAEQKKFEELADKRLKENETYKSQIQTMQQDRALTNELVKVGVVDLDAALKLVDRSKLKSNDSGSVEGVKETIESLKTDKAYLFDTSSGDNRNLGAASNSGNQAGSGGQMKFKRSQLQGPEGSTFYQEHKAEIDEAYAKGLIEDDISPRR